VAEAPVRTRETASAGYRQALATHQASCKTADPAIAAAVERQNREQAREPEHLFGDGQAALEELRPKAARLAPADDSRARALQRARTERVGLAVPALQQPLERTA
jgi:hypothetical protein